jgi:hypothetical protein
MKLVNTLRGQNPDFLMWNQKEHIVAYFLKASIVEPEETPIAREQHGNNT